MNLLLQTKPYFSVYAIDVKFTKRHQICGLHNILFLVSGEKPG